MPDAQPYTLYISAYSPYSIKACALLGWAGVHAEVRPITLWSRQFVLKRMTGKTMVPMLRRHDWALNDSTRIGEFAIERAQRSLLPEESAHHALCWLLEEFADEWVSRWFIWERWHQPDNAEVLAKRVGDELTGPIPFIGARVGEMLSRLLAERTAQAGASGANAEALGRTRDRTLDRLEDLLAGEPDYLFGSTPTVADFGFYGQLEQYRRDPANAERMSTYPLVCGWLERINEMALPSPQLPQKEEQGVWRDVGQLVPLLREFVETYWRVLVANFEAVSREEAPKKVEETLGDGVRFTCAPSGYAVGRLEAVCGHLDALYAHAPEVLASVEPGLREGIKRLRRQQAGRQLLKRTPALRAALS